MSRDEVEHREQRTCCGIKSIISHVLTDFLGSTIFRAGRHVPLSFLGYVGASERVRCNPVWVTCNIYVRCKERSEKIYSN